MQSLWVSPGIRFNDCLFGEPVRLAEWLIPKCAALFAILVHDPEWSPKPFQPLYFGELGNNSAQAFRPNDFATLLSAANGRELLVSILPMPYSTTAERLSLLGELVTAYNPLAQPQGSKHTAADVSRKLDELLLLLAGINRLFEPQPEPRRRDFGFLPPQPARAAEKR